MTHTQTYLFNYWNLVIGYYLGFGYWNLIC